MDSSLTFGLKAIIQLKKKADLFLLISSMSKSERRYFTVDAQKSNSQGSKYLELFKILSKQDVYDEKILRKKIGSSLPFDKKYLYNAILRSMRDYRSKSSSAAQMREMILDTKYLHERGHLRQSLNLLTRAKKLSFELLEASVRLEILNKERQLKSEMREKDFVAQLEKIKKETAITIEEIEEEVIFNGFYDELSTLVLQHFTFQQEKQKHNLSNQYKTTLLEVKAPVFPKSERRYYQCLALFYQLMGDYEQVYQYYTKVIDWWENYPSYRQEEFNRYIVDLSNLMHAYISNQAFDLFPPLLKKMENSKPRNFNEKGVVFQKVAIYTLMYHLNTGIFDHISELLQKIETGLNQFSITTASRLAIVFNTTILLFITEDFDQCQLWAERVIKKEKSNIRIDLQKAIRVLHLFSIIDEDPDLIDKTIRTFRRFLNQKTKTKRDSFEHQIISHFQKIANAPLGEMKEQYRIFLSALEAFSNDPNRKIPFGIDTILSFWVNSRLRGKTIRALRYQEE